MSCLIFNESYSALVNKFTRSSIFFEYRSSVIYSLLYASVHRLYLSSDEYSLHYLSDIFSVCGFQGTLCSLDCESREMEMERFELLTPCLQGRCSPN